MIKALTYIIILLLPAFFIIWITRHMEEEPKHFWVYIVTANLTTIVLSVPLYVRLRLSYNMFCWTMMIVLVLVVAILSYTTYMERKLYKKD